jgi:hypothetical protein
VRVSECVCVSEEGGREGGGGRGADTELKTKTPHVNVGNNVEVFLATVKAEGASILARYKYQRVPPENYIVQLPLDHGDLPPGANSDAVVQCVTDSAIGNFDGCPYNPIATERKGKKNECDRRRGLLRSR